MAKIRKKDLYFNAYSILEVIVSTIIIMILFLLFSLLMGQLMTSRKMVPETKLLLMATTPPVDYPADTAALKNCYPGDSVSTVAEMIYPFSFMHVTITDKSDGKLILQYYTLPVADTPTSLFQE